MKRIRLRFWLLIADSLAWVGLWDSPVYDYAIQRASAATDWGGEA